MSNTGPFDIVLTPTLTATKTIFFYDLIMYPIIINDLLGVAFTMCMYSGSNVYIQSHLYIYTKPIVMNFPALGFLVHTIINLF